MDKVEKDDFIFALSQTLHFYGKELDRMQTSFWWTACKHKTVASLKSALLDYVKVGKYAPRPADIISLADNYQQHRKNTLPPPDNTVSKCPQDVANAWQVCLSVFTRGGTVELFKTERATADEFEKCLHIVNHEAHKYGMPEAIPDEFKLKEVWG